MISRAFVHQCDVRRATPVGSNGRVQRTALSTDNLCLVVPMSSRAEIENSFTVGTGYDVYFPGASFGVAAGDSIEWNGLSLNVRAVQHYDVPRIGHTHALAAREGQ